MKRISWSRVTRESVAESRFVTASTKWARCWIFAGKVSDGWDLAVGRADAGSEVMFLVDANVVGT